MSAALLALLPPGACDEALEWVASLPESTTPAEAWAQAPRGQWTIWLLRRSPAGQGDEALRKFRLVALECAELVVEIHDRRAPEPLAPDLAALRAWVERGEGNLAQIRSRIWAKRKAVDDAADAYAVDDAACAAYAATASDAAAYAYAVAVDVDEVAAASRDRAAMQARTAEIVRRHFPVCPIEGEP